jgi:Flp pilus assembly protein TadD
MAKLQDFKKDIPLLVESGLIAIKQGDEDSAKKLFTAVGVLDPKNSATKMGFGLIALHKMDLTMAEKNFKEVLKIEKTNYRAQAFLGFSYILSVIREKDAEKRAQKLKEGMDLVSEVYAKADNESTKKLAESLLEWVKEIQEKGMGSHLDAGEKKTKKKSA